jgi:spermidine synthase
LNGNLQFSSIDEYRYHEPLVHLPIALLRTRSDSLNILVLGGGDGLAVRELLRYNSIRSITLVDLDPRMTELARTNQYLSAINDSSLWNPLVRVIHQDAFVFVQEQADSIRYDCIIADLPDPTTPSLARLYSKEFYGILSSRLVHGGVFVTQATSPYYAAKAFWCIDKTLQEAGLFTLPAHAYVPSFGDWGFILSSTMPFFDVTESSALSVSPSIASKLQYLQGTELEQYFHFGQDILRQQEDVSASTLDQPVLMDIYHQAWKQWD